MNMKKFIKIYIFICVFPVWILSKNIFFLEKLYYLIPYFLFYLSLVFFLSKNQIKKSTLIFLSLLTSYGLDQNLSLNLNIIKPNQSFLEQYFSNIYYSDFFLLIFIFLFVYFFFLLTNKEQTTKIIFSFLLVTFVFKTSNVLFKSIEIINFDYSPKIELGDSYKKQTLFIILDEMSGMNSEAKNFEYGELFNEKILNFSEIFDFEVYTNTYSISEYSKISIPSFLNFIDGDPNEFLEKNFIGKAKKFNDYDVIKNRFFEKFNNISVYQTIHLNYCNQKNVKKCYQFDPYQSNQQNLEGSKNNIFSKFFTLWKIDGSSAAKIFWKTFQLLGITDNIAEPQAHKIFLPNMLNKIKTDLIENKYDLIFAHFLAPHRPFGFNKECLYDGKVSSFNTSMKYEQKMIQHNIERVCMIKILNSFFDDLKNKINYQALDVIILSDHDARIKTLELKQTPVFKGNYERGGNSDVSTAIFISKIGEQKFKKNERGISIQKLMKEMFEKKK